MEIFFFQLFVSFGDGIKIRTYRCFLVTAILSEPDFVNVTTGNSISLTCNASGSPSLKYTWLNPSQRYYVSGNTLTIPSVGKVDEMVYFCNVSLNGTIVGECRMSLHARGKHNY